MSVIKKSTRNWLIFAAVLALAVIIGYREFVSPFPVMFEAEQALAGNDDVTVIKEPYLLFEPANRRPRAGLVFYTGARVQPEAYAPIGAALAERGYLVAIPSLPFNYAFLGVSTANDIMGEHPDVDTWVIAGHSLGGAMAASFADRTERIDGLVLLGAYPGSSLDLSNRDIEVSVVYGGNDALSTRDEVQNSVDQLPSQTEFVFLPGANHAQFGWYGLQPRDGEATISRDDQTTASVEAIVRVLADADR